MFSQNFMTYSAIASTAILAAIAYKPLQKLYVGITFFSKSYIVDNFRSVSKLEHPYNIAYCTDNTSTFIGTGSDLPDHLTVNFKNQTYNLKNWLKDHWTTGLVILKIESLTEARLVHESYYLGNSYDTKTISWSVGKSVTSALVGIAISEGKIGSIDDLVTTYIPELKGSAYDDVKIVNLLQMTSGVRFNENYDSILSDINTMAFKIGMGYDLIEYIRTLSKRAEPGTSHNYISIDTQVLGMVLKSALGEKHTLSSYLEKKIWTRIGCESDCYWLTDNKGTELAFGTLNATTRDYARFGWLYLNKGVSPLDGSRVVDEKWINDSVLLNDANPSYLRPNYPDKIGYGYQWWIPGSEDKPTESSTDYMAIGVYNQFVYVDPVSKIVIARNSANPNYNEQYDAVTESNSGETQAVEAFRAIAKYYTKKNDQINNC